MDLNLVPDLDRILDQYLGPEGDSSTSRTTRRSSTTSSIAGRARGTTTSAWRSEKPRRISSRNSKARSQSSLCSRARASAYRSGTGSRTRSDTTSQQVHPRSLPTGAASEGSSSWRGRAAARLRLSSAAEEPNTSTSISGLPCDWGTAQLPHHRGGRRAPNPVRARSPPSAGWSWSTAGRSIGNSKAPAPGSSRCSVGRESSPRDAVEESSRHRCRFENRRFSKSGFTHVHPGAVPRDRLPEVRVYGAPRVGERPRTHLRRGHRLKGSDEHPVRQSATAATDGASRSCRGTTEGGRRAHPQWRAKLWRSSCRPARARAGLPLARDRHGLAAGRRTLRRQRQPAATSSGRSAFRTLDRGGGPVQVQVGACSQWYGLPVGPATSVTPGRPEADQRGPFYP